MTNATFTSPFPEINGLLENNQKWAKGVCDSEPEFFPRQTKGQAPGFLWIGCADSRVPESVVMNCKPGEVFVHRNIANQFQLEDDSANSLLDYGVMTVGVKHVMVVGHSACGGCIAAYHAPAPNPSEPPHNSLTRFLDPLVKLRHGLPEGSSVDDLIEANVKLGVENLAKSDIMKAAWAEAKEGKRKEVFIHGWVFDLATGLLRDLGVSRGPNGPVKSEQ